MSQTDAIQLGPFSLQSLIGHGGMGEVWRGLHVQQGVEVAIKVLTAERARDASYHKAFRDEVRAVARLDHPGIVMVFDHGEIGAEAAEASGGHLVSGSPYLVMEMATIGVLSDVTEPMPWPLTRRVLLELLDGLSHAHARQMVHRDLKPGNVLLTGHEEHGWSCKLTDFGIAHAIDRSTLRDVDQVAGTPSYMAPEQLRGAMRDYGPWTDLYALGCVAWELVTGKPPFPDTNLFTLIQKHMGEEPPKLEPRAPIPPGLDGWLRRLLQKDPRERFRRAADAANALSTLPEVPGPRATQSIQRFIKRSSVELGSEDVNLPTLESGVTDIVAEQGPVTLRSGSHTLQPPEFSKASSPTLSASALASVAFVTRPPEPPQRYVPRDHPLPETWRRPEPPPPPMQLVGVGLGLYGLRPVRLVDRLPERDAIWDALLDTHQNHRPRALLLTGAAGTGKSRLAEWMAERAHELGGAIVLRASHSPIAGPADGLPRMLSRYLRCAGLSREETLARVNTILTSHDPRFSQGDSYEGLALTELIDSARTSTGAMHRVETSVPASLTTQLSDLEALAAQPEPEAAGETPSGRQLRFASNVERYQVIIRLLGWLCRERPVLLHIEDVQWGADALGFIHHLLDSASLPVLALMTGRDEELRTRPLERDIIDAILDLPGAERIEIEPLAPDDHAILVERLLGLQGNLARRVMERTAGNPLFAVQLVGDWVARGVLEVGDEGFRLKSGERAQLPDDIHDLYTATLEHVFHVVPELSEHNILLILELAAALGKDVIQDEWNDVCAHIGIPIPPNLIDALTRAHLIQPNDIGWSFTHGMFRESLRRSARESLRWQNHHRICASVLAKRHTVQDPDAISERVGMHHLAARNFEEALDLLLAAATRRLNTSGFPTAHALFALRDQALRALNLPPTDRRCAEGWTQQARTYYLQGNSDDALPFLQRVERYADPTSCADILAEALFLRARITYEAGDRPLAIELARAALDRFIELGDRIGRALCRRQLGEYYQHSGDLDRAQHYYIDALELWTQVHERDGTPQSLTGIGRSYIGLATACSIQEKPDDARQFFARALTHLEAASDRYHTAWCINAIGELERAVGDLERAEQRYREALDLLEQVGSHEAPIIRFNLAYVLLTRRNFDASRAEFVRLEAIWTRIRKSLYLPYVHASLLACAAHFQDWPEWERVIALLTDALERNALIDDDIAFAAHLAGELAHQHGNRRRATEAFSIAHTQWKALGRIERLAELEPWVAPD